MEASFRRYYEASIQNASIQHNNFQNSCNASIEFCKAHRETFSNIWSKLTKRINSSDTASSAFETSFTELMDKVLADFLVKNSENTDILSSRLNSIGEAEKDIKTEIRCIETDKERYDQELKQMYQLLDTVYVELNKIKAKAESSSESLNSRLKLIKNKTEANELNINELNVVLKEKSSDLAEDIHMAVVDKIKPAVTTATTEQKKLFSEMKSQSKKLNEISTEIANHIDKSLQNFLTVSFLTPKHFSFKKFTLFIADFLT